MKLEALIQKIAVKRREEYPFPDDLEAYVDDFMPNVLLKNETLQKAFGISDFELEEIYAEAYDYYCENAFEQAETAFRWLVLFNPFTEKYWLGLGSAQMMQSAYEKALHSFAMSALLNSENPDSHLYAFECYLALDNMEDAEKALHLAYQRTEGKAAYIELRNTIEELLSKSPIGQEIKL